MTTSFCTYSKVLRPESTSKRRAKRLMDKGSWRMPYGVGHSAGIIPRSAAYDLVTLGDYDPSRGRTPMTCYIVLGAFIASNVALIAGVMLNQRG
ncbi:hypothetical protein [Sphingomonas sp. 2SG]|uniref:hypothetical protein n=1 Tax=Sphingomonas sp. 2SG TaxID=2502201 RepID=UPI0010F582C2|nr:hypothetical protein [Sphingomonas sp. 2SG]